MFYLEAGYKPTLIYLSSNLNILTIPWRELNCPMVWIGSISLSWWLLKLDANDAEGDAINELINSAKTHLAKSQTSLDLNNKEGSIKKIKNLLLKDSQLITENEVRFSFEIRALQTEHFIGDMHKLGLGYADYTMSIWNCTIVNISSEWNKMSKENKLTHMGNKYVRNDNKITPKTAFSLVTTFLQSHASESCCGIAFLDSKLLKFPNRQAICINLCSLAGSGDLQKSWNRWNCGSFNKKCETHWQASAIMAKLALYWKACRKSIATSFSQLWICYTQTLSRVS